MFSWENQEVKGSVGNVNGPKSSGVLSHEKLSKSGCGWHPPSTVVKLLAPTVGVPSSWRVRPKKASSQRTNDQTSGTVGMFTYSFLRSLVITHSHLVGNDPLCRTHHLLLIITMLKPSLGDARWPITIPIEMSLFTPGTAASPWALARCWSQNHFDLTRLQGLTTPKNGALAMRCSMVLVYL